jgi:hypothetical protein
MRSIKTNQTYWISADAEGSLYYVPDSRFPEFRHDWQRISQSDFEDKWSGYEVHNCDKVILLDTQFPEPLYVFPTCMADWDNERTAKFNYRFFEPTGYLIYSSASPIKMQDSWKNQGNCMLFGKADSDWAKKNWHLSLEERPENE